MFLWLMCSIRRLENEISGVVSRQDSQSPRMNGAVVVAANVAADAVVVDDVKAGSGINVVVVVAADSYDLY